MKCGANIRCCVCGARPFPEGSLPAVVREEHDLLKLEPIYNDDGKTIKHWMLIFSAGIPGEWVCPQHRKLIGRAIYQVMEPAP